jgi:hypothetical protein
VLVRKMLQRDRFAQYRRFWNVTTVARAGFSHFLPKKVVLCGKERVNTRYAWAGGTFFPVVQLCQFSVLAGNRFWFYILLVYLEYHTVVAGSRRVLTTAMGNSSENLFALAPVRAYAYVQ